jgi:hypothetical protein
LFRDAIHDDVMQVLTKNSPAALMTNSLSLKAKQQVAPSGTHLSQSQPVTGEKKGSGNDGGMIIRRADEEEKKQGE